MSVRELLEHLEKAYDEAGLLSPSTSRAIGFAISMIRKHALPQFRPPQPSDDGRWCFLEELPNDAPPKLVRLLGRWQFWIVAGWRELAKGVWPCERPEGGVK